MHHTRSSSLPALLSAHRLLTWLSLDRLLLALLFLVLFAASATTEFQSDTWWQLRSGQLTWQSGFVWTTDPLSFTSAGAYWPNHEWLTQILYFGIYAASGLPGLVLFTALVTVLTWVALYRLCAGPTRYLALILGLSIPAHTILWAIRPHMLTFLLFAVLLLLLRAQRRHWLIPPLFLIWANLHGGVAFGGVALVVAALVNCVYRPRTVRRWVAITAASATATLCTPLGLGLWWFTIGMLHHPQTTYIQEWLPPQPGWPVSYPFFALASCWVGVLVWRWQGVKRALTGGEINTVILLVLGVLLLVLGMRAIRHTGLFAIVALPLITQLGLGTGATTRYTTSLWQGVLHALIWLTCAAGAIVFVQQAWAGPQMGWQPLKPQTVSAIRACPGPLFNSYVSGGALLWFVPERRVFVDSRNDPYPLSLLYAAVIAEQRGEYRELFEQHGIQCAFVSVDSPLYHALRVDTAWRERYVDDDHALFAAAP